MARMPGATWQPKNIGSRARRAKGRGVAYHVAVSEAQSLMPGTNADWHFYVAKNGAIYQYIDTDYQSWATGEGNSTMISVETQGGVHNADGEPWTDAQLDSLAAIAVFANQSEGVPLRLMASSAPSERGLGWHKLGVDPWRAPGGELWSSARGKICPGLAKIAQMPQVLARAQATLGGELMAKLDKDDYANIAAAILGAKVSDETGTVRQTLTDARQIARRAEKAVDALAAKLAPSADDAA